MSATGFFQIDIESYDGKVASLKPVPYKVYMHLHRYMHRRAKPRPEYYDNGYYIEVKKGQLLLMPKAAASDIKMASSTFHENLLLLEKLGLIRVKVLSHSTKLVTLPFYKAKKKPKVKESPASPKLTAEVPDGNRLDSGQTPDGSRMGAYDKPINSNGLENPYTKRHNKLIDKKAHSPSLNREGALSNGTGRNSHTHKKKTPIKKVVTFEEQMRDYHYKEPTSIRNIIKSSTILKDKIDSDTAESSGGDSQKGDRHG